MSPNHDLVIIGTGFASSFFLMRYLERAPKNVKVLVLVGFDWPIAYDDLESHYGTVEQVMLVSGPSDSPMPRTRQAPLVPHRFSDPDILLKQRFPDGWYQMSTARASVATGQRGICCASGICGLCPVDAKFTIQNGLSKIYQDARVTLRLRCEVQTVETAAGVALAVNFVHAGCQRVVQSAYLAALRLHPPVDRAATS